MLARIIYSTEAQNQGTNVSRFHFIVHRRIFHTLGPLREISRCRAFTAQVPKASVMQPAPVRLAKGRKMHNVLGLFTNSPNEPFLSPSWQ